MKGIGSSFWFTLLAIQTHKYLRLWAAFPADLLFVCVRKLAINVDRTDCLNDERR